MNTSAANDKESHIPQMELETELDTQSHPYGNFQRITNLIKEVWPFLVGFVVTFSLIKEINYYSYFKINILQYVGILEVLNYSLDEVLWAVVYYFLAFIGVFLWLPILYLVRFIIRLLPPKIKPSSRTANSINLIIVVSVMIGGLVLQLFNSDPYVKTFAILFLGLSFSIALHIAEIGRITFLTQRFLLYLIIIFGSQFIFIFILKSFAKATDVYHNRSSLSARIKLSNGEIRESNKEFLYVGDSHTYLFFYDKQKERPVIYSKSNILELEIEDEPDWFYKEFRERKKK